MKQIKVNPNVLKDEKGNPVKGQYLVALDAVGRQIKYKPGGNLRVKDTHLSRMLKCGDLVLVGQTEEKKTPKPVVEAKVTSGDRKDQ